MSVAACAALVERGDPDRFMAVMAAPVALRVRLFPLYAFNLEIARAPWVTTQPMIAEMRLQWWRDVVAEPAPRAHEVVGPLHGVIQAAGLPFVHLSPASLYKQVNGGVDAGFPTAGKRILQVLFLFVSQDAKQLNQVGILKHV